jgi:hypothetical protein
MGSDGSRFCEGADSLLGEGEGAYKRVRESSALRKEQKQHSCGQAQEKHAAKHAKD